MMENIRKLKNLIEDNSYMEDLPTNPVGDFWVNILGYRIELLKGFIEEAMRLRDFETIKELIKLIPDRSVDKHGFHKWAIRNGGVDIVRLLIKKNIRIPNYNILAEAIRTGDMVLIELYEKYTLGYHFGGLSYLTAAIDSGDIEMVKHVFKKVNNMPEFSGQLNEAIWLKDARILRFLLERGADPNIPYCKPLEKAVERNNLEAVKLLVEHGANYNFLQASAFRLACERGYVEIVKYFLTLDIKTDGYNNYALRHAKKKNHKEVVKLLEEYEKCKI